jgi:hypothetical protein
MNNAKIKNYKLVYSSCNIFPKIMSKIILLSYKMSNNTSKLHCQAKMKCNWLNIVALSAAAYQTARVHITV